MNTQPIANEALDAFWQVIVKHFPKATTGDLSPLTSFRLDQAAETAIKEWITYNALTHEGDAIPGYRFKLFRDIERFSDFVAPAGLTGTVTDLYVTGVWAKMDQHMPRAEYWENHIFWETREDFASDTVPI